MYMCVLYGTRHKQTKKQIIVLQRFITLDVYYRTMTLCQSCNHQHSQLDGQCFKALQGQCSCTPQSLIINDFDYEYRTKTLEHISEIHQKVTWVLEAIPGTRNLNDWEFIKTCWHYFIKFKFGDSWNIDVFKAIEENCQPETIRRARQKVCHLELEQLRIFEQEISNIVSTFGKQSNIYEEKIEQIKEFWKNTKYIPNDLTLLRKKKLKESAIFEYSILEIEDVYHMIPKENIA